MKCSNPIEGKCANIQNNDVATRLSLQWFKATCTWGHDTRLCKIDVRLYHVVRCMSFHKAFIL